jgi:hypothetical protein
MHQHFPGRNAHDGIAEHVNYRETRGVKLLAR